jgi:hypothetical protein
VESFVFGLIFVGEDAEFGGEAVSDSIEAGASLARVSTGTATELSVLLIGGNL